MPELSNLLRQRLGSRPAPWSDGGTTAVNGHAQTRFDSHPDADTLTSYVEKLLPQGERNRVLSHLAACVQCREVLTLSFPQVETPVHGDTVVLAALRRRRFFWIPRWGLAASAVAVALVAGVLLVERAPKTAVPVQSAKQEAPSVAVPATLDGNISGEKVEPAPGIPNGLQTSHVTSDVTTKVASNAAARAHAKLEASKSLAASDRALFADHVYDVRSNVAPVTTVVLAPERLLTVPEVVTGERGNYLNDKIFSYETASQAPRGTDLPVAPAPHPVSPGGTFSVTSSQLPQFTRLPAPPPGVHRGSPAPVVAATHTFSGFVSREVQRLIQNKRSTVPIYAGGLTFSAMGGPGQLNPAKDTSQSVVEVEAAAPVATPETGLDQISAFSSRARSEPPKKSAAPAAAVSSQLALKVAGGKLLKSSGADSWVEAYPSAEGIEFSTWTGHGSEVWAGGNNAALVHSRDAGATWERITLGASATGTIIKIEASALNVHVTSSSGQSWSSVDGGKSWTLQE